VDHGDPLNGGPRVARRFNDLDTGQITGGIYSWYDGKSAKTAFSGKVTKYADKFWAGATTSSSGCSTTAAWVNTPTA
jgi:hypothetical protein